MQFYGGEDLEPKTILIVDDCASIRILIEKTLRNHNTISAENGIDAIKQVIKYKPYIIILDLHMPRMDGLGVLKYLQDNHIKIHVIVVTSFEDEKLLDDAFDAGADDILLKPIRPAILKAQVCRVVKSLEYKKIMAAADELKTLLNQAHDILKSKEEQHGRARNAKNMHHPGYYQGAKEPATGAHG